MGSYLYRQKAVHRARPFFTRLPDPKTPFYLLALNVLYLMRADTFH